MAALHWASDSVPFSASASRESACPATARPSRIDTSSALIAHKRGALAKQDYHNESAKRTAQILQIKLSLDLGQRLLRNIALNLDSGAL
jgi:hypothetical protein